MRLHKYLEETIDLLWRHRNWWKQEHKQQLLEYVEYKRLCNEADDPDIKYCPPFDYPDYGALPRRLYSRLDGDFVDAIQNAWPPSKYERKGQFKRAVLDYAGMDMRRYLGRK